MKTPELGSLYQQLILEHYRKPRNKRDLPGATADVQMRNPTCGDEVHLKLTVNEGRIDDVAFTGEGCSISQAAVSMMTQQLKGASVADAMDLARAFTRMMHGDPEPAGDRRLGDLRALQGVHQFPVRVKCALLAFDALQEALKAYPSELESSSNDSDPAPHPGNL